MKIKKYTAGVVIAVTVMLSACAENKEHQTADGNGKSEDNTNVILNEISNEISSEISNIISNEIFYEGVLADPVICEQKNTYDTLNVATYITKIDDTYFIADCYHDQIIYHDNITDPLNQWSVLTSEVHYAHTVASDGTVFVVDDTEHNRLMVFQKTGEGYAHIQTLDQIGMRPHYVQYDAEKQVFMAWSSITGEMYLLKRTVQPQQNGIYPLYVDQILKIEELYGVYVRSFTVMEDGIYFVSGHNNQKIIKAVINDAGDGFEIAAEYHVAGEIAGMVQLTKIGGFYYITVSTDDQENQDFATIVRTDSLDKLGSGEYEDIYDQFGVSDGTPYYITQIDGRYYMAHHRTSENILAFDVSDDTIENVEIVY